MYNMQSIIKLSEPIRKNVIPRPYEDHSYVIKEGVYITQTLEQLATKLAEIYKKQGLELVEVRPMEITLRRYLDAPKPLPDDDNTGSNQSSEEVTEGT